jgi:toxin-antitoxin system PIN domain toxin
MRLLDVNVLIALAWPSHVHHRLAQDWFSRNKHRGWSTCPITQMGFIRISSNPKFIDGAVSPSEAIGLLRQVTSAEDHSFWADTLDIANEIEMLRPYLLGHKQITDAYLLALAVYQKGKLVTLDGGIATLLPDKELRKKHLETIT